MLGSRIRQLRQQKGISLTNLAEKAGISKSMLSQVEREIANPSVDTVRAIALALEVPVFALFLDESGIRNGLVRKADRLRLNVPGSHGERELLTPDLNRRIVLVDAQLPPGASSSPSPVIHRGDTCLLILRGSLQVHLEEEEYILEEGDTLYFNGLMPHYYVNCGDSVAEYLAIASQEWER